MPARRGLLAPQNTFLDTIATRFDGTHSNFVLGNAKIAKSYPIVYCSDGFCELTCYSRAQIMQKSCACNFLYGLKTEVQHREAISRALETQQELKLEVVLYKSSKTPFWCLLDIVPIQDEKHEVVLFLCSHKDITKQKLQEQQRHQLAELHAQKQQQLADQHHLDAQTLANQQQHQQHQQHAEQGSTTTTTDNTKIYIQDANHPNQQQQQLVSGSGGEQVQYNHEQPLNAAQEAELAAIANQNALISMDEFGIEDSGGENEFDDADDSEDYDKQTASQYSRRRSRAVLYQLSGHYGDRRNVNMKSKLKLNNRMNIPEYKTTTIEKQRFILSHYGLGKSCWDWLILAVTFYVAIVVPYNAAFKDKLQNVTGECKIDSFDIGVEVVFVIDVILNFRTTFVNRKGEVVTRPKTICKHYIRGWFVVDAFAALPFDLLCGLNIYSRSRLDLNLLKLIRLLRLARLLQKMDRYSQYSYIILTLLMLIFSLLAHWCACIWYVIAMQEIELNPPDWKIGWIHQLSDKLGYNVVNTTDMSSSYVTALYFTTSSLTSVGFGNVSANTNAEKIFSIVIMLIGALMHALVFGNVTALIRVMYARRSNYQTRLRDLKDFFRLHQLPKELQQRMSDYFQTTWSLNHGIETFEILKDFPEELRGDVSLHLHREVLSLPIFESAPQGFLKSLAQHIESKFCCPTEYLIHRGDALNYLYLVCNGSMEVLQDNMVVAILGKGDLVGYDVNAIATPEHTQYGLSKTASLLVGGTMSNLVKSSSDLKALTYCDLKCIHISGLLEVLKLYPEFSDTFHREIIHDLSFNLRETRECEEEEEEEEEEEDQDDVGDGQMAAGDENGDDHDDDDDDDDNENENDEQGGQNPGGAGFSNGARAPQNGPKSPPPPSNMGHLFRSIADAAGNQIGRYDHEFVGLDEAGENEVSQVEDEAEDEEGDEEDVDDDDDDEGDDDDDESGPPSGSNGGHKRTRDGGGDNDDGLGGAPSSSSNAPSSPSGRQLVTEDRATEVGRNNGEKNNGGSADQPTTRGPQQAAPLTGLLKSGAVISGGRLMNGADCVQRARQLATTMRGPTTSLDYALGAAGGAGRRDWPVEQDATTPTTPSTTAPATTSSEHNESTEPLAADSSLLDHSNKSRKKLSRRSLVASLRGGGARQLSANLNREGPASVVRNRSYDILIDCGHKQTALSSIVNQSGSVVATTLLDGCSIGTTRQRKGRNLMRKNNSEELADEDDDDNDNDDDGGHQRRCHVVDSGDPSMPTLLAKSRLKPAIGRSNRRNLTSAQSCIQAADLDSDLDNGGQQRRGLAASSGRKPPLSFDLSRNTTAIVDRRRRSAGCIPRPLLMGHQNVSSSLSSSSSSRAKLGDHSSSLTHINEDDQTMMLPANMIRGVTKAIRSTQSNAIHHQHQQQQQQQAVAAGRQQVRASNSSSSASTGASNNKPIKRTARGIHSSLSQYEVNQLKTMNQAAKINNNGPQYASQDLRSIDARISGISASVREMQQAIKFEMNQVRSAMQLMMQLLDKQTNSNQPTNSTETTENFIQSTNSLASSASSTTTTRAQSNLGSVSTTTGGGICSAHMATTTTTTTSANSTTELDQTRQHLASKCSLLRSQSTISLPANSKPPLVSVFSSRAKTSTSQLVTNNLNSPPTFPACGNFSYKTTHNINKQFYPIQATNRQQQGVLFEEEADAESEPPLISSFKSTIIPFAGDRNNDDATTMIQRHPNAMRGTLNQVLDIDSNTPMKSSRAVTMPQTDACGTVSSAQLASNLVVRPLSECSSSPLSFGNSNSGQSNPASDNDSGRSSSSMNLSNPQHVPQLDRMNGSTTETVAASKEQARQVFSTMVKLNPHRVDISSDPLAYEQIASTPLASGPGRFVKMLVASGSSNNTDQSTERYTIDLNEDRAATPESPGGSMV